MSQLQELGVVLYFIVPALALIAIAYLWLVIQAFRAGVWWGLAVLFFPPAILAFVPMQWKLSRGPAALFVFACVVGAAGFVAGQFTATKRDPRVKEVNGELHVTLTRVQTDDYSFIKNYPKVAVLHVGNENVTDETLEQFENLTELYDLDLSNTKITDKGLAIVAKLPKLRSLNLTNTAITEEGIRQHLFDAPELIDLNLIGCKQIKGKTKREWEEAGKKFDKKRNCVS